MLTLEGITKTYRGPAGPVPVLRDFALRLAPGDFVAVCGPSGCGKTTLLLIAGGLLAPDAGRVLLDDSDLYALSPGRRADVRARAVGFVFQQFHLVPYLSVFDNVLAPTLAAVVHDARKRADDLLARFGLADRRRHLPGQLSTGERQRTALARALLPRPKVVLADEPTGNLDDASSDTVLSALHEFAQDGGAVLLVTHDTTAAARAARVIRLEASVPSPATASE